jgi:hypothetical protein
MNARQHLRLALDGQHPRLGRMVELALLALVVVSALGMGVETLSGLPDWAYAALGVLETVVIVAFALEYVLRLAVAERPWRYVTSFYGVIDLLSFLPSLIGFFHAGSVLDARALRTLRLRRLLRLLKIARYANAADRLQDGQGRGDHLRSGRFGGALCLRPDHLSVRERGPAGSILVGLLRHVVGGGNTHDGGLWRHLSDHVDGPRVHGADAVCGARSHRDPHRPRCIGDVGTAQAAAGEEPPRAADGVKARSSQCSGTA